MKRMVVVLLLLIANAVFGSSEARASSEQGRPGCAATGRLAWSVKTAGETPAVRTGEDARAPLASAL